MNNEPKLYGSKTIPRKLLSLIVTDIKGIASIYGGHSFKLYDHYRLDSIEPQLIAVKELKNHKM